MSVDISFADELADLEARLEQTEEELDALLDELDHYTIQTKRCRDAITKLRSVAVDGKLPDAKSASTRASKIEALSVSTDTGRPQRGAREEQIQKIYKKLGRGGKSFRTIDVINELQEIEGELSNGMRSYTYTVLNNHWQKGQIEKVKRGTWKIS